MTYEITITDGSGRATNHRVELRRSPQGELECRIDGKTFTCDSAHPEPDVLSLLVGGRSYEVRRDGQAENSDLSVVVAGRRFTAEVSDPRSLRGRKAKAGATDGPRKIVAPMPGKVVRILAGEGTRVEAGQGVIVIEAMKMQNELKSPKAGKVKKIMAAEGAAVTAGDALAIVE